MQVVCQRFFLSRHHFRATVAPFSDQPMKTQKRRRQIKKPQNRKSTKTSIDDLPECILLHILSFLPTTTAVITTAVSRKWRHLCYLAPIFNISMERFHSRFPDKTPAEARQLFAEFVSQTLLRRPRHFPIEKFKLSFYYKDYESMRSYVNSWVHYVISSKVTELELDFETFGYHPSFRLQLDAEAEAEAEEEAEDIVNGPYEFDFADLINSSVKVLRLSCCYCKFPGNALSMKCDSIREVHIQDFCPSDELENLIALCVNLEILSLVDNSGFGWDIRNLKIVSEKLKHLKLGGFHVPKTEESSVEICTSSLISLGLDYVLAGKYALKDTSSLVEAHVTFGRRTWGKLACWTNAVSLLRGVERLTTENMWTWFWSELKEESINTVNGDIKRMPEHDSEEEYHGKLKLNEEVLSKTFSFDNLKHLELLTGYLRDDILGLEVLLRTCPKLETMILVYYYQTCRDGRLRKRKTDRSIILQMPSLKLVKMKMYRGTKNELFVVGLLKKHGVVLEKIVAFPAEEGGTSSPPFVL